MENEYAVRVGDWVSDKWRLTWENGTARVGKVYWTRVDFAGVNWADDSVTIEPKGDLLCVIPASPDEAQRAAGREEAGR